MYPPWPTKNLNPPHYNPDASHPLAVEDQARALKASLETARAIRAAPYTIAGLGPGHTIQYGYGTVTVTTFVLMN
jgi:hypothetical protein